MASDYFALYAFFGGGILVVLALTHLAYSRPAAAVSAGCLMVLIADTKFRIRDPKAQLTGAVDGQIVLELALYGLIAVIAFTLLLCSTRRRVALRLPGLLLCGYVGVCIASFTWSLAPAVTLVRSFQVLVLFAFTYAAVRVIGAEPTGRALTVVCAAYVLVCVALVPVLPQYQAYRMGGRFGWFYVHPIVAGTYAAVAALCVLSVGLYSARGWRERLLWCPIWIYPLPLVTVLLMTNSRGPLLAFVGGAGILLLKRLRPHTVTVLGSLGFLVILGIVGSTSSVAGVLDASDADDNIVMRQILRGQNSTQFLGLSGRVELWQNALGPLLQHPLTGYGYQGSRTVILNAAEWAGDAHSAYLQTLLDVGALGGVFLFSAFLLVVIGGFPGQRRRSRWDEVQVTAVIVFVLLNAITHESFAIVGLELLFGFACVNMAVLQRLAASTTAVPERVRRAAAAPLAPRTLPTRVPRLGDL